MEENKWNPEKKSNIKIRKRSMCLTLQEKSMIDMLNL